MTRKGDAFGVYRFRRRGMWIAVGLALIALVLADSNGWLLVREVDDLSAYHGMRTTVVRVIDGDTIEVNLHDALHNTSVTRIALWGINCPEPARADRAAEPWSADATAFTASHLANAEVVLWLEAHQTRDAFGRVLAHVELPDGARLNEVLLEAGLAKVHDRWPHAMLTRYGQLEQNAKRRQVGVWSATKTD